MGFLNGVYYAFQIKDRIFKVFEHKHSAYVNSELSNENHSDLSVRAISADYKNMSS